MSEQVRARALFSGRVQGVGFRFTTRRAASGYRVDGYVRNLPDGNVEIVAEGDRAEVKGFLDDVAGRMERYVEDVEVTWGTPTGQYEGFTVRF